jgi:hypothetical protein
LAINLLRGLEQELSRASAATCEVKINAEVITHMLNYKRDNLLSVEARYGVRILFHADTLVSRDQFTVSLQGKSTMERPVGNDNFEEEDVSAQQPKNPRRDNHRRRDQRDGHDKEPVQAVVKASTKKAAGLLQGLWRKIIE